MTAHSYPDKFLSALGEWQRGWREDHALRLVVTERLLASIGSSALPCGARQAGMKCYRKRFLVANNPQNGGDMVPLFVGGSLDEGAASWTTDLRFAQDFKDPLRVGNISAVFGHVPIPQEVVLNIPALWADPAFSQAVRGYANRGGENADALQNFRAGQSEIILNAPLLRDDIEMFCGRSSPFDVLCDLAGVEGEDQRDQLWQRLVETGTFPEEARWISKDRAQEVVRATEGRLRERIAQLNGTVTQKR